MAKSFGQNSLVKKVCGKKVLVKTRPEDEGPPCSHGTLGWQHLAENQLGTIFFCSANVSFFNLVSHLFAIFLRLSDLFSRPWM